jgi:hypothetical protein
MGRKICLVGQATKTAWYAESLPSDVEMWGQNESYIVQKRGNRWFQIHPRDWRKAEVLELGEFEPDFYGRRPEHVEILGRLEIPVYMKEVDERVPSSVKYPFDEITAMLGETPPEVVEMTSTGSLLPSLPPSKRLYLTSTSAYMLALALYEHLNGDTVDEMHMAGIEMAVGTEYSLQKPCVEYWLGRLKGAGVDVVRAPMSELLRAPLYAIDHEMPFVDKNFTAENAMVLPE